MTKMIFLERAREVHGYKYEYPSLGEKVLSNDIIDIIHNGICYKQKVVKHILLGRCPEKNTPKKTTEEFIKEAKSIWGEDKYDYSLTDYKGALKKIKVIYDGIVFEQIAVSHLSGLAPENNMNQEYFIKKSIDRWGDKYDYSLVVYKNCSTKVKIIHNGVIYEQTPTLHAYRAPENIHLATKKTTEQFIKEANIVHDFKYLYNDSTYINAQTKIIITCPIHKDFSQTPNSHLQGNGCPNCNESRGEKIIAKYLDKHNISYYRQHKFENCKNVFQLPFDFFIPSSRICIEFDGKQHYEPMDFFGGIEAFEKLRINDNIKNDYCEDNFIDLIRIKYNQMDDIVDILNKALINII